MTKIYEAMFLLDNQLVRENYNEAKKVVDGYVRKHGGTIKTARHWGERRLAYPIAKRNRATYLLTYCELDGDSIAPLRRDLELNESVLRNLITRVEEIPEDEVSLAAEEEKDDFSLPEPPQDDAPDEPEGEGENADGENADGEMTDGEKAEGEMTEAKAEAKDAGDDAKPDSEPEKTDAPKTEDN